MQRKSGPLRSATLNAPVEQMTNRKQRMPARKNGELLRLKPDEELQ